VASCAIAKEDSSMRTSGYLGRPPRRRPASPSADPKYVGAVAGPGKRRLCVLVPTTTARRRFRLRWPALFLPFPLPICERAVDITPVAACPSTRSPEPSVTIEHAIGALTAAAAMTCARALRELARGRLTQATRAHGGDLVQQLYVLRQATVGELDFDRAARTH